MLVLARAKSIDTARAGNRHQPCQWRTAPGIICLRLSPNLCVDIQQNFFCGRPIGDYAQDQTEYEPAGRVIEQRQGKLITIGHSLDERRPILVSSAELSRILG